MVKSSKSLLVVCTTAYRPLVGGAELAIENITKRLRDDFDVVILTARLSKNHLPHEYGDDGEIIRLGVGRRVDKFLLPLLIAWKIRQLKKQRTLVTWGVMVSYASIGARIAQILWGTSFVLTLQEGNREWETGISQWWWGGVIRGADHVTAISSFLLSLAHERGYRGSATLVPNGVDESFFYHHKRSESKELRIVSASRLVHKNGIDVLIAGCALLPQHISWHLTLAGDGPLRAELEADVTRRGLQEKVTFLGNVAYHDLPEVYRGMTVFIRPARSEGLGTAFLEAMASGLVTVGTPVGGIVDFLKDGKTGFLVKQDDAQSVADVLTHISQMTESAREALALSAQNLVKEKYQWNAISQSMEKVFRSIQKKKKIVIATPLYPPDIGGPAAYAEAFHTGFQKHGYATEVVSFGGFLRLPPIIRHAEYALDLWRKSKGADVIVSLDQFSVGFPAALVARARAVPMVFRIGGDFLWERAVEQGVYEGTIRAFYESGFYRTVSGMLLKVVGWTLSQADGIVFNTSFQKDLYKTYYRVTCPSFVVHNAISKETALTPQQPLPHKKTIVYAGRIIKLKNLRRLIEAFSDPVFGAYSLVMLGDGPEAADLLEYAKSLGIGDRVSIESGKSREEIHAAIQESTFCSLVSYGDVSPNFAFESLSLGKALVLTEATGIKEVMPDLLYVDPSSTDAIRNGMRALLDDTVRHTYEQKALQIRERSWGTVVDEFIESLKNAIPSI